VLGDLGLLQASLSDVETGVRGYALTGQETFLDPYRRGLPIVAEKLRTLRTLTADNASQQRRLDTLEPLVALTLAHLGSVTAAGRDKSIAESGRLMKTIEGKRLMDQVRHGIADMVAEEQRLLRVRELRQSSQFRVTTPLLIGCGVLVFSLVASSAYLLNRQIEQRRQAQEALQQAHDQVRKHAGEVEAANKELEAFSYSISHDLRAPLRAIVGYASIVIDEYAPQLNPELQGYLQDIRANTVRMGRLVDDLLGFARLSRQPVKKQTVAADQLVRRCLEDLQAEQDGRRIEIRLRDLPSCQADPALLRQVWFNLLGNALKYTARRDPAVIEIGCHKAADGSGRPAYYIRDNGVGFDMRYAHKLFGVFQRLHRTEDYDGTGVGLAIVQRIVHRHGGTVWAEAQPDQGATFSFTLEPEVSPHA
jgi:signal transduction histidine kinase